MLTDFLEMEAGKYEKNDQKTNVKEIRVVKYSLWWYICRMDRGTNGAK